MDLVQLRGFFLWCMLVNTGVYALTAVAVLVFRDLICKVHKRMFDLDEQTVCKSMHRYLASYKLLITVFNFAPWIAVLIIA